MVSQDNPSSRAFVSLESKEEIKSVIAQLDNGESIIVSIRGHSILHITHNDGGFSFVEGEDKESKKKGESHNGE